MVRERRLFLRAYSNAARRIRVQPFLVMMRVDMAISPSGVARNGFILG